MCRIALYAVAGSPRGFEELVESFVEASLNDFVLHSYRKGRRSHNHGWGFACVQGLFGDLSLMHFKTSLPLPCAKEALVVPRRFDWLSLILHSRLTSGEPIDVLSSHPFYASVPGKLSLWLAHNGGVDKERLAKELSMERLVDMYTDSYFLAHWLAKNIEGSSIDQLERTIKRLIELNAVKTSLNFVALILDEKEKRVLGAALNYVCGGGLDLYEYYKLYRVLVDDKALAVASSTIALYMEKRHGYKVDPLENGELLFVSPQEGKIVTTSRMLA